jgi:hypothetical protein
VGDTIYAETRVLATRESRSRPDVGIVSVRTRGLNQDGQCVVSFRRSVMVSRRSALADRFPKPATDIASEDEISSIRQSKEEK